MAWFGIKLFGFRAKNTHKQDKDARQKDVAGVNHVAIIMDGNGRWAVSRGYPRLEGHRRGGERLKEIIRDAPSLGIKWLTVYAFSTENWRRSGEEIQGLMSLLEYYLKNEIADAMQNGVRVRFIGKRDRLGKKLQSFMERLESSTKHLDTLNLTIAIDYGSRDEIVRASKKIADDVAKGLVKADDVDEVLFAQYLDTAMLPDPDLIIRTSGEMRTSNFLLYQGAYAEYEFPPEMWPEFNTQELARVLADFAKRDRRYGGVSST